MIGLWWIVENLPSICETLSSISSVIHVCTQKLAEMTLALAGGTLMITYGIEMEVPACDHWWHGIRNMVVSGTALRSPVILIYAINQRAVTWKEHPERVFMKAESCCKEWTEVGLSLFLLTREICMDAFPLFVLYLATTTSMFRRGSLLPSSMCADPFSGKSWQDVLAQTIYLL